MVTISAEEYHSLLKLKQNMADAQYVARAVAEVRTGASTFSGTELDAYLAAPSPLAY